MCCSCQAAFCRGEQEGCYVIPEHHEVDVGIRRCRCDNVVKGGRIARQRMASARRESFTVLSLFCCVRASDGSTTGALVRVVSHHNRAGV